MSGLQTTNRAIWHTNRHTQTNKQKHNWHEEANEIGADRCLGREKWTSAALNVLIKWKLNQPMAPVTLAKWGPNENLMVTKWQANGSQSAEWCHDPAHSWLLDHLRPEDVEMLKLSLVQGPAVECPSNERDLSCQVIGKRATPRSG